MPARIWGHRFGQRGNTPAWHFDGLQVGNQKMTAVQMLNLIGSYRVQLFPLYAKIGIPESGTIGGEYGTYRHVPSDYSQIWRLPTKDDPRFVPFGAPVSKDYELISPVQGAQIWDRALTKEGATVPVETMGILKDGQVLFITAELPSFDVMGDEVKLYLLFYSPMYSNTAAVVAKTAVRTVCWNTLVLGLKTATSQMVLPHTPGAATKIEGWIRAMYQSSERTAEEAKHDFLTMAQTVIRSQAASAILKEIYPDPPEPQRDWSFGISYDQHLIHFDRKMDEIAKVRRTIMELFGGEGLGQNIPPTEGTVYGLYNAVSEYESYRISSSGESLAISVTTGDRALTIKKAYNHCLKQVQGGSK